MYYISDMDLRSRNHYCREKAINIIYSESGFVALVIQEAKHMRRITCHQWRVGSTAFFTLSRKRHDFRKNVIEHKKRVLIFSITVF